MFQVEIICRSFQIKSKELGLALYFCLAFNIFYYIQVFFINLYLTFSFIALIHPIQWTIANPVGTDRPAKHQKKTSCVSTGWPVPVLCIRQVVHGIYFLSRQHDVSIFFVWRVYCADVFSTSPVFLRKSVHYDGFSTLYVVIFPVEVLSTDQARIYLQKSAGNAP